MASWLIILKNKISMLIIIMRNKNPIGKRGSIVEGQKLTKAKGADLMHKANSLTSVQFILSTFVIKRIV